MFATEQERIDSLTMRIERTDVKGSGFIQFPPQRPFQQPIEMQPPTMAHQAHPEFYRAPANGLSAPRPAYHQGGMRPQMAGNGMRPQSASNGARPQMAPATKPAAPHAGYTPAPTQSQANHVPRPAPNPAPSNGRDYRPSPSAPSNQVRPAAPYRPPQPTANGYARPSYANAAPGAHGGPRGGSARPQMQGRPPSRDAPSASYSGVPSPRPQAPTARPHAATARPQAPTAAPAAPQPAPVARPAPVAAPLIVPAKPAPEPEQDEAGGGLSKSQLKRLRKKKREGAL